MTLPAKLGVLRESNLFANLDPEELEAVGACAEERRFAKGDLVFLDGTEAVGFYVVVTGAVKIFKTSRDAKELILHIAEQSDSFAEAAMFAGKDYPAAAEALADSQLLYFARDRFRQLLVRQPNIALKIMGALSFKLRFLVRLIEDLTLKDIEERLAEMLLVDVRAREGKNVEVAFSKKILAARLGTIPETLSRTLRKLRDSGLIEVEGLTIRILRPELLRELVERSKRG